MPSSYEYAGVHLLDNPYAVDRTFDYFLPPDLREKVRVGSFLRLPFGNGNRTVVGLCTELHEKPADPHVKCKPVFDVTYETLSLSEEELGLVRFLCETCLCTVGDAVRTVLPLSSFSMMKEVVSLTGKGEDRVEDKAGRAMLSHLAEKGPRTEEELSLVFGTSEKQIVEALLSAGAVRRDYVPVEKEERTVRSYRLAVSPETVRAILTGEDTAFRLRSEAHARILRAFLEIPVEEMTAADLRETADCTPSQVKALADRGILSVRDRKKENDPLSTYRASAEKKSISLNSEQEEAVRTLDGLAASGEPKAALLWGVTGSGKTCVMLTLIERALARKKGVIVLLPEIALTPQTLSIFCSRFGERVAVIHSGLSPTERMDSFRKIREGKRDVVIGTRSAVFAPVKDLGLIICDEEHEHTYKSDQNPKYHARDVARYRAVTCRCLLLLASATPSFESFYKAEKGIYTLVTLQKRYGGAKLPKTTVADMREEMRGGNLSPLSTVLLEKLTDTLKRGEQAILFLNRRGYNSYLSCRSCGEAVKCPDCSVSMTYHTYGGSYDAGELRCHWCGKRVPLPKTCPVCGSDHLSHVGYGTQRVEQELHTLLPQARVLRMDADTAATKNAYETMLGAFRRHEYDILLGTQMVTKGHDFPDVTLVGVLLADTSLYLDDYRAAERTFSLLTQVIGRAGRADKPGEAVIQTNVPDKECIRLARAQDYRTFYEAEMPLRRTLVWPPFCDLAVFTLVSTDERELLTAGTMLTDAVKRLTSPGGGYADVAFQAFGPFEAPVYKVDNRFRLRLTVKCRLNKRTRALFAELLTRFGRNAGRKMTLTVDFNPSSV